MIVRADIIATGLSDAVADRWVRAARIQSTLPGFVEAKFYRVSRLINKTPYHFLSVTEWAEPADYVHSLRKNDAYTYLDFEPLDSTANTYTLVNSAAHTTNRFSFDHLTVINPYRIPVAEAEKYARMWEESGRHMEQKEGFVSAQFYRAVREDEALYFVSRAEWQSEKHFMKQFEGADFRKIIAPFEGLFSISLSYLHAHVTDSAVRLAKHQCAPAKGSAT